METLLDFWEATELPLIARNKSMEMIVQQIGHYEKAKRSHKENIFDEFTRVCKLIEDIYPLIPENHPLYGIANELKMKFIGNQKKSLQDKIVIGYKGGLFAESITEWKRIKDRSDSFITENIYFNDSDRELLIIKMKELPYLESKLHEAILFIRTILFNYRTVFFYCFLF